MTKKEEALQKIEELKEVIKNIEKEEEKPKLYPGQLCYVWNDDYDDRTIRIFDHINDLGSNNRYTRNTNSIVTEGHENYEPLPFDPRSCAPPDAVAYAVDADRYLGYWFTDKPSYESKIKRWVGEGCRNSSGMLYAVYDSIRGADPENSLVYWGDE